MWQMWPQKTSTLGKARAKQESWDGFGCFHNWHETTGIWANGQHVKSSVWMATRRTEVSCSGDMLFLLIFSHQNYFNNFKSFYVLFKGGLPKPEGPDTSCFKLFFLLGLWHEDDGDSLGSCFNSEYGLSGRWLSSLIVLLLHKSPNVLLYKISYLTLFFQRPKILFCKKGYCFYPLGDLMLSTIQFTLFILPV